MTRLSFNAKREAERLSHEIDSTIRLTASQLAETDGKEFADEVHVRNAYRTVIVRIAANIEKECP